MYWNRSFDVVPANSPLKHEVRKKMKNQKPNNRYIWSDDKLVTVKIVRRRVSQNTLEVRNEDGTTSNHRLADTHESKFFAVQAALCTAEYSLESVKWRIRNLQAERRELEAKVNMLRAVMTKNEKPKTK